MQLTERLEQAPESEATIDHWRASALFVSLYTTFREKVLQETDQIA
jgi:hypothetical protein